MTPNRRNFVAGVATLALVVPGLALASTAANTKITNTATVTYNDAGSNPQTAVTATADVTVTLVASAPNLSSPANVTIDQGATATLVYTITATANGPDPYHITATETPAANMSTVVPGLPANFTLGGTTLASQTANGNTSITVPYDQVASNASINGLVPGNTIVIGGNAYVERMLRHPVLLSSHPQVPGEDAHDPNEWEIGRAHV
jgi:hypothetical protein